MYTYNYKNKNHKYCTKIRKTRKTTIIRSKSGSLALAALALILVAFLGSIIESAAAREPILLSPKNITLVIIIEVIRENRCNVSLETISTKEMYENESITFTNNLIGTNSSHEYIIAYTLEDISGNSIQTKKTSREGQKSFYLQKQQEETQPYWIKSKLEWINCNNINKNTESSALVILKLPKKQEKKKAEDKGAEEKKTSKIEIKENQNNSRNTTITTLNNNTGNNGSSAGAKKDQTKDSSNKKSINQSQQLKDKANDAGQEHYVENILNTTPIYEARAEPINETKNKTINATEETKNIGPETKASKTSTIIYESQNTKSKKIAYYMILAVFACIAIFGTSIIKSDDKKESTKERMNKTEKKQDKNERKRNKTTSE